ncbi:S8 family serine peptidase [Corallococcus macrosporus]|uniref:S8A family peptidase n=1 Tax=Myxococcus fulvus (strain ATCC BAA-855 / HW-1) TaxID=483219 RepID=F8CJF6_MYXFH|nr:S8 family serine peptidase [Corallococcus macrosporus]AEI62669.1 S8A family peptidase [Corallococcus macrosporus]
MRRLLSLGLLLLTATACSGDDDEDPREQPPSRTGRIQGTLTPFQSSERSTGDGVSRTVRSPFRAGELATLKETLRGLSAGRSRGERVAPKRVPGLSIVPWAPGHAPLERASREDPTIPGDVILRFEEAGLSPERVLAAVQRPGFRAVHKGYASEYVHLVGYEPLDGEAVTAAKTQAWAARLAQVPGVTYAVRNERMRAAAAPDDRGYSLQWHYPTLNLPAAWDLAPDASSVVVAVIDSGVVPHPDLTNVLPGYDMISDPENAGDGDGRDSDPRDEGGDTPSGGSTWHGSHVAGTIGANTNNQEGVAGVAWNARLLPVRVLGKKGGTSFDIAAALTWATGGSVPGVPDNPTPAKVVNMSLGGRAPPQALYQDAIDAALGRGAIIVVAAGNEDVDARNSTPCNQQNVICVGSTSLAGQRSSFSNFGVDVDVVASGGEMREDLNGDGYPDGVLSTVLDENGQPAYAFSQGTSMASPHVAGVVALMAASRPDLDAATAEGILKETATPLTNAQCPEGCGAGLVNALAALARISNEDPGSLDPRLNVTTSTLFFRGSGTQQLILSNVGGNRGGDLMVTATKSGPNEAAVSFPQGNTVRVPAFGSAPLAVAVDASGLPVGDTVVTLSLVGSGTSGAATVAVKIGVAGAASDLDAFVAFVWQDARGEWQTSEDAIAIAPASANYAYSISLTPRTYYALATIDDDQDGNFFEDGERTGYWRNVDAFEPLFVEEGERITDVSFDLIPLAPIDDDPALVVGSACGSNGDCPGGVCVTDYPGGYCSMDCTTSACPAGSRCYIVDSASGLKACLATCSRQVGTGQGDCRSGYVCYSDGTGSGACQPNCRTSGLSCGGGRTCLATGFCQ